MADIPRSLLDDLTAELNAVSSSRQALVLTGIEKVIAELADDGGRIPDERIADLRNASIQIMDVICTDATEISAARSAVFYDAIRALADIDGAYASIVDSGRVPAATEEAIRGMVDSVRKTGKAGPYVTNLLDRVDYEVKRASSECILRNGRRDKADVKFARVPAGTETCAFCIMLASRGFVYRSAKTAGEGDHWHAHCDCRIVPSFGADPSIVEGYDSEGLYRRYKDCADTLDDDWLYRQYETLPGEKRSKVPFDEYKAKQILKEMATRNAQWLNQGTPGSITQDANAQPLPKELQVAEWLTQHGFDVHFRETRESEEKRTSDILIQGVSWEIKQPHGAGKRNISNQFNEAKGQSDKLIIDISCSPWDVKDIEQEAKRQLDLRDDFSEVLLIDESYMKRIK